MATKTKVCTRCNKRRSIDNFPKKATTTKCKKCFKEYQHENYVKYYQKQKEKWLAKNREWKRNNKDKIKAYFKKWYQNNKDKVNGYVKKYRTKYPEKYAKYQARYWTKRFMREMAKKEIGLNTLL